MENLQPSGLVAASLLSDKRGNVKIQWARDASVGDPMSWEIEL